VRAAVVAFLLRHGRWPAALLALGALTLSLALAYAHSQVRAAARERCFERVEDTPPAPVALVLGCSKQLSNGRANLYFEARIRAAAELFHAGVVDALLVSGDNHRVGYDEPTDMKQALVELGVPAERVHCDYAGLRTLDSVVRAAEIFDQRRFVVVSQRFHAERAVYLARAKGLEAFGFDADAVRMGLRARLRESAARLQAVLDVRVFDTAPRFLGPKVAIARAESR
jgi:SanA protein